MAELLLSKPASEIASDLARGFAEGRSLRIVNYHSTPRKRAVEYARDLDAYAPHYSAFGEEDLEDWFAGRFSAPRPPVIPVLFEGFRDNYDVILPMLEARGLKGWFILPSHFPNVAPEDQRQYAKDHTLHYHTDEYPGERIVATWDELRDAAARGHSFANHSRNHAEVLPDTPEDVLYDEIVESKREFEEGLGRKVEIFCWLHGADVGINPRADEMLREAGYRYLFSNFKIQKLT